MIPAQSNSQDAQHFANLAQLASDSFFSELLGSKAESILASVFQHTNNDYSYAFTQFLMDGESVAGMLNGFTAKQKNAMKNQAEWLILKYATWRFVRYLVVGMMASEVTEFIGKNLSDGDYYIQMVAIYPQFRGRGHSKIILQQAEETALSLDCHRLVLDVDERNTPALNAYKKVGFTVVGESQKTQMGGDDTWGLLRMAKAI
jgi:ribosomal protein S18 acetylase RimI-like enzyme